MRRGNTNNPSNPWFTGVRRSTNAGGKEVKEYYYLGRPWHGPGNCVGQKASRASNSKGYAQCVKV